jgi:hypothetical protein
MSVSIEFNKPIFKKTYYISRSSSVLTHNLIDVTIKRVQRLKDKGYVLTLLVSSPDQIYFKEIDDTAIYSLLANNATWFSNELNEDDINALYHPALCSQNNTINVYISSDFDALKLNNKRCKLADFMNIINDMSYLKKYTINIQAYHTGLYIYSTQTMHKWGVKTINMYSIDEDMLDSDELENIEKFWGDLVQKSDEALIGKIKELQTTRANLQKVYSDILEEKKSNKDWESKIGSLKKMIQNIIF